MTGLELVDPTTKGQLIRQALMQEAGGPSVQGLGYAFPLRAPENGAHYRPHGDYEPAQLANCAKWPQKLGLEIPEESGNLAEYLPRLLEWHDKPKDARPVNKGEH